MRFARVAVPAYGPFTDLVLDLPDEGTDFHLLYGPNEAGKSSLLRAIRDLLYGIHGQTPDAFLHGYRDLRIAGTVVNDNGGRLNFQRRKGNVRTLLDEAGEALPDDALAGFLGGVDRDFFATVFGLGSTELREGAEGLLRGEGEVGQALFSASLAGTPVHRVLESLDTEAEALFNGRARTHVTIRPAVSSYQERLRQSRDATVRPDAWTETLQALAQAESARAGIEVALQEKRARRSWVERCLSALPILGQLEDQERSRAALPPAPDLPADFVAEAEQSLARRDRAREAVDGIALRIDQLASQVEKSAPDLGVLARSADIEAVAGRLGVYHQWREERASLEADFARVGQELRDGMRALGVEGDPEAVETLRVLAADELALEAAAGTLEAAAAALGANVEERERLQQELDRIDRKLSAVSREDVTALRDALSRTSTAAEVARVMAEKEGAQDEAQERMEQQRRLLNAVPEDPAAVFELPVPGAATLRRFDVELSEIEQERMSAQSALAEARNRHHDLGEQLSRLERRGSLPTLIDLYSARTYRDEAWKRVRAAWKDGAEEDELDGRALVEAYPGTVIAADRVADRLREEAEAVAQAEGLRSQQSKAAADRDEAHATLERVNTTASEWQERWRALWSPCRLDPATPPEMQEWRDQWWEFRTRHETWKSLEREIARGRDVVAEAMALLEVLTTDRAGQPLMVLRDEAERRVRAADEARGERRNLEEQQAEVRRAIESLDEARPCLNADLEAARTAWQTRCRSLTLPEELDPASGRVLLERRRQLVARYDTWKRAGSALQDKQAEIATYEAEVHALSVDLGLAAGSVESREAGLRDALSSARELRALQHHAQTELEEQQMALPGVQLELQTAQAKVTKGLAVAGSADEVALSQVLGYLKDRHAIDAEIGRLHESLHHAAARGDPLDDFIARVRQEPADALEAERQALDQEIGELDVRRDEAIAEQTRAEAAKRGLEASGDDAAEHMQAARNIATQIRHDARRFLRLQLARQFLGAQIERFRAENQAPLLTRAGEIFHAITEGSFTGLGTDYGDSDQQILTGLREGERVGVEGMSEGTRDQLYLALRLAAIEHHQRHHEPMPLILDDVLVTFDDRRARAVLGILSELGSLAQILLFTHHHHILELAREALSETGYHLHELPAELA